MSEGKRSTSLRFGNKSNKLIPRDISDSLGKLPPQCLDLEEIVLGGIMLDKDAINKALASSLKPEHFYDDRHAEIFEACLALFRNSDPIDMRTVVIQLRKTGKIEQVGGAYYIAELTSKLSTAANIEYHIRVVQEKYMKRSMIQLGAKITQLGYNDETDIWEDIEDAQKDLFALDLGANAQKQIVDILTLYNTTLTALQNKTSNNGITGVPSYFQKLDLITSGWQRSDLILVAARPGAGKTAWMLSVARAAAREVPIVIFSLEMAAQQLMERLISADHSIENDRLRSGILRPEDWQRITADQTKLSSAKLFVDDTPAISIYELRSKCMRLRQEKGIEMVVIDYLQLMRGDRDGNREQEIASISRGLKNLAKELNIPIIALSQLSRAVEMRADKRPMLSDLRESGSLEMDSDLCIFLYRPEYYGITVDEEGMPTNGICEVIIGKHRNGGTGMVKIKFEKFFTRFSELEFQTRVTYPEPPQGTQRGFKDFQVSRREHEFGDEQYPTQTPKKDEGAPF